MLRFVYSSLMKRKLRDCWVLLSSCPKGDLFMNYLAYSWVVFWYSSLMWGGSLVWVRGCLRPEIRYNLPEYCWLWRRQYSREGSRAM